MESHSVNGRRVHAAWHRQISSQLADGETVVAWFQSDLDGNLRYADSLVVLTNRRLLAAGPIDPRLKSNQRLTNDVRSWPRDQVVTARTKDRSGLGTLEVDGRDGKLGEWRYTAAHAAEAHALALRLASPEAEVATISAWEQAEADEEDEAPTSASTGVLLRLAKFARPRIGLIFAGFVLTVAATAVGLIPTALTNPLTELLTRESIEVQSDPDAAPRTVEEQESERAAKVRWYLFAMAGAALLTWVLSWAQGIVLAWASERISADLRNETYAHLQQLSLEYFGGKRTGDLLTRVSTDTERICNFLSDNLVDFASDILMILGIAIVLFYENPILAVAAMLPLPFNAYLVFQVRDRMRRGFHRGGRAWGQMTSILADTIPGIRVVKAFAQEHREIDRFRRANDHIVEANDKVNMVWTFFWPMVALLNQLGVLIVWWVGARLVFGHHSTLTGGAVVMFLGYITRINTRLESMSRMFSNTQRAAAGAQRIFEVLDRVPSVPEPIHPIHIEELRGEIELRDVSFRHGNRTVLEHVSLKIEPKEMIGLVGPSGSGKSTLVNLVCRFYDVAEGAILVDGTDVRRFPVAEYRRNIGLVLQEPFLFFGTVADNISYGKPEATRDEIVAAAKAARAHEFILRLPLGYDSLVGERGQTLSGGERQRISIARALLIDPQILILDEATSSVDTETEREIQLALDHLIEGRTTIAIAHRLSTLDKADRLVVLERGRIVEIGKHQDLIEADGVYARLRRAQQEHVEMAD